MESTKKARRPRRKFTSEFRADVVRLCQVEGNIREVSKRLDLTETSVRAWVQAAAASANASDEKGSPRTEDRKELERLRRELKRVTMERDILKKATAFFAKENG